MTTVSPRPPSVAAPIAAPTSQAAQRQAPKVLTPPVGPITSLTAPTPRERAPTVAKAPLVAALGDDDLMSQRQ